MIAPSRMMPWMALASLMSGVCSVLETFETTSKPRKIARLAIFLGFEVVSKVSSTLHTPLMSEANAIHGIILLGAIMVAGQADDPLSLTLSIVAVLLATMNVVGGFVVTDRMLLMFS